jgi:hypothetical protein
METYDGYSELRLAIVMKSWYTVDLESIYALGRRRMLMLQVMSSSKTKFSVYSEVSSGKFVLGLLF